MSSILITRDLTSKDLLYKEFRNSEHTIQGVSFVEFNAIDFKEFPNTEWIFFYSRNGVKYFIDQLDNPDKIEAYKLAALGKGTAKELLQRGLQPAFTGRTQPKEVALEFINVCHPESVLFPRAVNSKNTIRNIIEKKTKCFDLEVYSNDIKEMELDFKPDIIVFTSPLNVEAFLKRNKIAPKCQIISIGPSTTEKLKTYKLNNILEAESPDDNTILKLINKTINSLLLP